MKASAIASRAVSQNAKVGAVALALGAFMTLVLSHVSTSLAPLRLFSIVVSVFATWCFCDEMGMKKPLNRAGFVFFVIAIASKMLVILGVASAYVGRYYLLFSAFLLLALLSWSAAFLHRQRSLKVVGAVGAVASVMPVVALLVGHLVVGAGAILGVDAILAASDGSNSTNHTFVTLVERLFGLWGYVAAWLLWRGHIQLPLQPTGQA